MNSTLKNVGKAVLCCLCLGGLFAAPAHATDVAIAGFAFAGDASTAVNRFPYTYAINQRDKGVLMGMVHERAKGINNPAFGIVASDTLINTKGSDQALIAVLVLTGETVSSETFGNYVKTFVNLRGDALIFDFKSKTIVRNYPISTFLFDATSGQPGPDYISGLVNRLLTEQDDNGLVSIFEKRIATATLPAPGNRNIQVHDVQVSPEALAMMPEGLSKDPKTVQTLVSDTFSSIISAKLGVPMLPAPTSHKQSLAVMSFRLQDVGDIDLNVGEGDYLFDLKLNKFAKIKSGESSLGSSYVFGAYTSLRFYEPLQNTNFINSDLKNGEVKVVPASQLTMEDFPAFEAALRGLFIKFGDAVAQSPTADPKWIGVAASAKDMDKQMDATRRIIKSCK